jgi:glutamate racemase
VLHILSQRQINSFTNFLIIMIGFYDSGKGGMTILNEVLKLEPNLDTFYYADSANCPLGEKTDEEIIIAVLAGIKYLFEHDCDLVILACNTATARAIKYVQACWLPLLYPNKNVLGVIRPVAIELIDEKISKESKIVILATKATVRSRFYSSDLGDHGYENVQELSMGNLAYAIETDDIDLSKKIIDEILEANINIFEDAKAVVLACTHYPYMEEYIQSKLNSVTSSKPVIISQNILVAKQLFAYLAKHPQFLSNNGNHRQYNS